MGGRANLMWLIILSVTCFLEFDGSKNYCGELCAVVFQDTYRILSTVGMMMYNL